VLYYIIYWFIIKRWWYLLKSRSTKQSWSHQIRKQLRRVGVSIVVVGGGGFRFGADVQPRLDRDHLPEDQSCTEISHIPDAHIGHIMLLPQRARGVRTVHAECCWTWTAPKKIPLRCAGRWCCNRWTRQLRSSLVKLTELFNLVKAKCSNYQHWCTDLIPVRYVSDHESECPLVPTVRCQVTVCQWLGINEQLYEHVSNSHPGITVLTVVNNIKTSKLYIYYIYYLYSTPYNHLTPRPLNIA